MKRISFGSLIIGILIGAAICGGSGAIAAITASPTPSAVFVDGKAAKVDAYIINGNNYFKLRDFCSAVDIGVWYQEATKNIYIETDKKYDASYTGPAPVRPGYYIDHPSVPGFQLVGGVQPAGGYIENGVTIYSYDFDSIKTPEDSLLRKYSDLLTKEGFNYVANESKFTAFEHYEGETLVEKRELASKIVYIDAKNNLKITAERKQISDFDRAYNTFLSRVWIEVSIKKAG